jgi:hypothetical protein
VQVKADLTGAIAALAGLSFGGTHSITATNPSYGTACAAAATGKVKQFLTHHPCKEYASAHLTAHTHGDVAQVTISWVALPTTSLANQYKVTADTPQRGNPPGQSPTFNELCYASGQNGTVVWTEQVEPTGNVSADRQTLQAAAPAKLSPAYLQQHCVD